MKTIISILALFLISLNGRSQVHFSINAGPNFGNIKTTSEDVGIDSKLAIGYIFTGYAHIPVSNNLKILTGLEYESIHAKIDFSESEDYGGGAYSKIIIKAKQHLDYVNIPLKLMYSPVIKAKGKLEIGGGPFIGIGLSGKGKGTYYEEYSDGITLTKDEETIDEKIKFGSGDDDNYKRINFGLGLNVAYSTSSNLRLGVYTNIGLSNIDADPDSKTKTFTVGLTVGYVFGAK
ncbi:MAG: outer membrane beta-barrel protein [Ferruginibacter sp.]